jgi:hypothetical protein
MFVKAFVIPFYYGSGSNFLTSYGSGSGSTRQKVTVPVRQHCPGTYRPVFQAQYFVQTHVTLFLFFRWRKIKFPIRGSLLLQTPIQRAIRQVVRLFLIFIANRPIFNFNLLPVPLNQSAYLVFYVKKFWYRTVSFLVSVECRR